MTGLLFLIGYRGTGKSATARILANRLRTSWTDADALLEEQDGRSIRQIFAQEGESAFRDKEAAVLRDLSSRPDGVIATGGGVVLRAENRSLLRRGKVVWLTADADTIWDRLQKDATTAERRPNLAQGGLDEIRQLLEARSVLYASCADLIVDTQERTPEQIADIIFAWLRKTDEDAPRCAT